MVRAVLLFASLSLAACSSCSARRAAPAPAASTAPATPAPVSTPPPPAAPTADDLVLGGTPTAVGVSPEVMEAEARGTFAPLRECARMMPIDSTFSIRYLLNDTGSVRDLQIEGALEAPIEECVRRVARELRFTLAAPTADASVTVPVRAVARPDGVAIDPSLACTAADECVFVTGNCQKPFVVHRVHAERLDRLRRQVQAGEPCPRSVPTVGYEAVCFRGMCTDRDVQLSDVACTATSQCTAVALPGGGFVAAAKAHARDVATRRNGHVATAADSPPPVSCQYGGCLVRWAGGR